MSLQARMARRDRAVFVGRQGELALFEALFVDDPPANLVLMHGPAGIGKSALLREVERRGRNAGWTPIGVEGRDLPPLPDALEDALAGARETARPLILIDSYEQMTALGRYLRRAVLPRLPEQAVVVISGRLRPERAWFEGGLENVSRELELGPLSPAESEALLAAHGFGSDVRARGLAAWAGGSPLLITLAADAAAADPAWSPGERLEPPQLVSALVRRACVAELDPGHLDVLAVAAIARVTTEDMLGDVLPQVDSAQAIEWLSTRTFAEPLGGGVTIHELVRRAVRAELRRYTPERERELRRRIADHLHERAVGGQLLLTIDLAELTESKEIRALYSWPGTIKHRIDRLRAGDAERIARRCVADGYATWWDATRPLVERAPQLVEVIRDTDDDLCGYGISVTPRNAPPAAYEDPLLARWLKHARSLAPDGNAILCREVVDFTGDRASGIYAMVCMANVLRSGLANPRYCYLCVHPRHEWAGIASAALGAQHVAELDVRVGSHEIECHLLDHGPRGLLGRQRDVVYAELGLTPPGAIADTQIADGPEAVREALRNLRVPRKLAVSPLARGETFEERAASVQTLLREAAEQAFGDTPSERLLKQVLIRGYIKPASTQERAAEELNLSRSAYFRRLRLASERLAEYVSAAG